MATSNGRIWNTHNAGTISGDFLRERTLLALRDELRGAGVEFYTTEDGTSSGDDLEGSKFPFVQVMMRDRSSNGWSTGTQSGPVIDDGKTGRDDLFMVRIAEIASSEKHHIQVYPGGTNANDQVEGSASGRMFWALICM